MGIYGDSLLSFTEQFQDVEYYNQSPKINAGFENQTTPIIKSVVLHSTGSKALKDSNGNIVYENQKELWSQDELQPGYFIKFDDDVYRITKENNWNFEDGFYKYGINKVVGDDGTLTEDPNFNKGEGDFQ